MIKKILTGIPDIDYVECVICSKRFLKITCSHLQTHHLTVKEYRNLYTIKKMTCEVQVKKEWKEGRESPFKDPKVRAKCDSVKIQKYGYSNAMLNPIISQKAVLNTQNKVMKKYGYKSAFGIPEIIEKNKHKRNQTVLKTYGVTNVMKVVEISLRNHQSRVNTCINRYGVDNVMKVVEINSKSLKSARTFPNNLEQIIVNANISSIKYVGRGDFYIRHPLTQDIKCPDFIVKNQFKVIELFGDYYHGMKFSGLPKEEHYRNTLQWYEEAGYKCLIFWEHEVKKNLPEVISKIYQFISSETSN